MCPTLITFENLGTPCGDFGRTMLSHSGHPVWRLGEDHAEPLQAPRVETWGGPCWATPGTPCGDFGRTMLSHSRHPLWRLGEDHAEPLQAKSVETLGRTMLSHSRHPLWRLGEDHAEPLQAHRVETLGRTMLSHSRHPCGDLGRTMLSHSKRGPVTKGFLYALALQWWAYTATCQDAIGGLENWKGQSDTVPKFHKNIKTFSEKGQNCFFIGQNRRRRYLDTKLTSFGLRQDPDSAQEPKLNYFQLEANYMRSKTSFFRSKRG